jgi:hypothetical protein
VEDEDYHVGKEPWTIGQGYMVNTIADDVDNVLGDQAPVRHAKVPVNHEQTPGP